MYSWPMDSFDRMRMPGYVPSNPARGRQLTDEIGARVDALLAPYRHLATEAHMMVRHDELLNHQIAEAGGGEELWDGLDMNQAVETQALAWALLDLMHSSDATGVNWRQASTMAGEWYHYQRQGVLRQVIWRGEPEPDNDERPAVVRIRRG